PDLPKHAAPAPRPERSRGSSEPLERERSVRAAEAEGIRNRDLDPRLARLVRRVVEITFGILVLEVDRRRNDLVAQRENREDRFRRARRADHVARRRLRRADRELLRVLTERRLDRESLRDVAERRRRAVSVDVADLVRRDLRIGERVLHAEACALAL